MFIVRVQNSKTKIITKILLGQYNTKNIVKQAFSYKIYHGDTCDWPMGYAIRDEELYYGPSRPKRKPIHVGRSSTAAKSCKNRPFPENFYYRVQ